MKGKFLVMLVDTKYGSSTEERYTEKQVRQYLENTLEELEVYDVMEIDTVHTTLKGLGEI